MSSSSSRENSQVIKEKKFSLKKNKLILNKSKPSNLKEAKKKIELDTPPKTTKKKKKSKNIKLNKYLYDVNIQRNIQLLKDNDYNVNNEK